MIRFGEKKKKQKSGLSPELEKMVRVTPEMTEAVMAKLKYTIDPRPDEVKPPKGKLWCCYCGDWKKFGKRKKIPQSIYDRCETCNISTEDFHIKTQNKLWGSIKNKF